MKLDSGGTLTLGSTNSYSGGTDISQAGAVQLAVVGAAGSGDIRFLGSSGLGSVEIHRELMTAATRWIMAWKLWSVLSARMAIRLNSLSLQKKFSIR